MEKVSVIIPTYKRSIFLKRALESVLRQTYENIEIIVIDDNYPESQERLETEKIMFEYINNSKVFYIKNKVNMGGSLSRNKGIEFATGEFIAFLDDDDEYIAEKIEKQYYFYKEQFKNEQGFVYCQSKKFDENKILIPNKKKMISGNKNAIFEILKTGFTSTGCIFLPKKLLLEVEGFEKLICGQEWYLILKILIKGYNCHAMSEELLYYYEHSNERITNNSNKVEGELYLYEIKKKYIEGFSIADQRELNYINNINLANLHLKFRKKGVRKYLIEATKHKKLKIQDLLRLISTLVFSDEIKLKLKRILIQKSKNQSKFYLLH